MQERMFRWFLGISRVIVIIVVWASTSDAQNLLENGAFDEDIVGWSPTDSTIALVHRSDTGNELHGGSGPGSMEIRYSTWDGGVDGADQTIPVNEGMVYSFNGAYLSPTADNPMTWFNVLIIWYDEHDVQINWEVLIDHASLVRDEWAAVEGETVAPEGASFANIRLVVQNPDAPGETRPGFVFVDDLSFKGKGFAITSQEAFFPAAASTAGANGTFWTTSGWFSNLTDTPVDLAGAVLLPGQSNATAIEKPIEIGTIAAGGFLRVDDIFAELGASGLTGGLFIRATSEEQIPFTKLISASSYTSTPNPFGGGAFGQAIGSTTDETAQVQVCPGARNNSSHRTNVGALNMAVGGIDLEVTVLDASGREIGSEVWHLGSKETRQQRITTLISGSLNGGSVVFRRLNTWGPFAGYASVVDNTTGDAVYLACE